MHWNKQKMNSFRPHSGRSVVTLQTLCRYPPSVTEGVREDKFKPVCYVGCSQIFLSRNLWMFYLEHSYLAPVSIGRRNLEGQHSIQGHLRLIACSKGQKSTAQMHHDVSAAVCKFLWCKCILSVYSLKMI